MRPRQIAKILGRSRQSIEEQVKQMKLKLKIYQKEPEDAEGKRFGKLVLTEYIGMIGKSQHKRAKWRCICDCGKIREVDITSLKSGNTTSCGCSRIRDIREHIEKRTFGQHLSNAKTREYKNFLSKEQFVEIARKCCTYCKGISIRMNRSTGKTCELNSVDRRDNEPYYKLENSQSVCFVCQTMKMDMKHEEFLEHNRKIYENKEKA